ncbi:MAG: hypothetical protein HWE13_15445, partial [Gammaproteobacteria bacterium]|nr:hypothetical protein [Gammaproteobacteria bacterium]
GDGGGDGGGDGSPCDATEATTEQNSLQAEQQINQAEFIQSTNLAYRLQLQSDGNLVLLREADNSVLWASGTNGSGATRARMQGDGNWVLRDASGSAVWSSGTAGTGPAYLILHNDGNLAIYGVNGAAVWQTQTSDGTLCESSEIEPLVRSFTTPSASELFHNRVSEVAFPQEIATPFGGNGHSVSWDGRVYIVKRTQGWYAQVLRPENIVKTSSGLVDFNQGAFSERYLMMANENAPELQVNWLAIVIDPSFGEQNPYPSNRNGDYQQEGTFATYKALVYVTSKLNGDNDQLGVRRATLIIANAKSANASIASAQFDSPFQRFQTNTGSDVRCIEPSATIDGRLVICQGHPDNNGRIDNLVYSWNAEPGGLTNWSRPKSLANLYWDDKETLVDGLPMFVRYPLAENPLLDATGVPYVAGALIKGAYPWVSRDGSELFYQASREGVSARRTGTSVVGRWTGWTVRHIDGPINPQRGKSRLFLSSPGAFTTMWSPFKEQSELAIPYSSAGPVYPIFGSNSRDYSEVSFNDYLDGDFIVYYGMNEQLARDGAFQVTRTNDTSGYFNNGRLQGAQFPLEFNGRDELVGRYGQAIYFPASSYVEIEKNAGWEQIETQLSVDFWVKVEQTANSQTLLAFENLLNLAITSDGTLQATLTGQNNQQWSLTGPALATNTWQHIALTIDINKQRFALYQQGVLVAEAVMPAQVSLNTSGQFRFGLVNSSGRVLVDEFKVSKVARSAAEVAFFANQKSSANPSAQQVAVIPQHLRDQGLYPRPIESFSVAAAELGEQLFFDPLLSLNNTTSCATCHKAELNFTDNVAIAVGLEPTDQGERNAPMLLNRMFSSAQGWSGSAGSLAEQALQPIAAEHEMNLPIAQATARLTENAAYRAQFNQLFGADPN